MSEMHQVVSVPIRPGRPTNLLTERTRSESPVSHSIIRPSGIGSSPATDVRCDLDTIQRMFGDRNGVLCFGDQQIRAMKEDFNCEKVLAYGNCSEVHKVRHRSRRDLVMAVKVMYLSSNSEEENKLIISDLNVVTEISGCPFIVNYYGILFTGVEFWICMELMPTCLRRLLKDLSVPFPEHVVGKVVVSIVSALDYLKQKHNVIHRDVKPSNMLLGYRGEVKLCDFGISGKLKDSIAVSADLGCIRYMAPERLNERKYDVRADVWSLGVSILELATCFSPYGGATNEFALMTKIVSEDAPRLPPNSPVSQEFRHFVEMCLQKEVKCRPKYAELKQSDFFQRHNVEPLNVLGWLQTLNLPHLRQSFTSGSLSDLAAGSTTDPSLFTEHDRLCTATPTAEVSCAYMNGVNDAESFCTSGSTQSKGGTESDVLNVNPTGAPITICGRKYFDFAEMPHDVTQMNDINEMKSAKQRGHRKFVRSAQDLKNQRPQILNVDSLPHQGIELPYPSLASDNSRSSSSSSRPAPHNPPQNNLTLPRSSDKSNRTITHESYNPLQITPSDRLFPDWHSKIALDRRYVYSSASQSGQPLAPARSVSAGAQLRRSHARRWQFKAGASTDYHHSRKQPDQLLNHPEPSNVTDQEGTRNCASVVKPIPANMAPQQYHHHYYYYFYHPPRAMTPPLLSREPDSQNNGEPVVVPSTRSPVSGENINTNSLLSGRLTHRLHTHPPPRQNGCVHHIRRVEQCTRPSTLINPNHRQLPSVCPSEQQHMNIRRNLPTHFIDRPDTFRIRDPVRGSLRSSSQPARSHYWLSFETEL